MNPFFHALLANNQEVRNVSNIGDTLAYTWFGRPNWAYSAEAQKYWIGTTKDTPSGTTQHVTEYNINEDVYTSTQVGTAFQKDDHNQAQILIRESDKSLIAFYVEHNGTALRWRISSNPLDSTNWGVEKRINPVSHYSYISPYQSSNGDIYVFFRSRVTPSSTWYYVKSTDGGETFGSATSFYNNGQTHNYLITAQNGDKIHFTASNGHPQSNSDLNINVYHFYFDIVTETFHKSDNTLIGTPISPDLTALVKSTTGEDTSWILDISFKNNLPRILYTFYPLGRTNDWLVKELWFTEYDGENWVNNQKIDQTMSG